MDMDQSLELDFDMDVDTISDENSNSEELNKLIKGPGWFKKFDCNFDKMSLNEDKRPDVNIANNILKRSNSNTSCHSVLSQRITRRASVRKNMALMTPSKSKGRLGEFKTPTPSSLNSFKQSYGPHTYSRSQIREQLLEYKKTLDTDNTPLSAEKPLNSRRANWTPKSLFKSLDFEQNIIESGKKETQFNK